MNPENSRRYNSVPLRHPFPPRSLLCVQLYLRVCVSVPFPLPRDLFQIHIIPPHFSIFHSIALPPFSTLAPDTNVSCFYSSTKHRSARTNIANKKRNKCARRSKNHDESNSGFSLPLRRERNLTEISELFATDSIVINVFRFLGSPFYQ